MSYFQSIGPMIDYGIINFPKYPVLKGVYKFFKKKAFLTEIPQTQGVFDTEYIYFQCDYVYYNSGLSKPKRVILCKFRIFCNCINLF